jgi:AcrR family transcriptional regulator
VFSIRCDAGQFHDLPFGGARGNNSASTIVAGRLSSRGDCPALIGAQVAYIRRFGPEQSETRTKLLDMTERIMIAEGYAAVKTRRVAKDCGVTPGLVHYYFKTTDDLLVAAYRRTTEQAFGRLMMILDSDRPLEDLQNLTSDSTRTTLALEFLALANHRKVIGVEIARYSDRVRRLQSDIIAKVLERSPSKIGPATPAGLTTLLVIIARGLTMEENVGISTGHAEARELLGWLLGHLAPAPQSAGALSRD